MKTTSTPKKSASEIVASEIDQKLNEISETNQKQLQNIFQHVPMATAVFEGHEHKFILANKAYEKLFNRKAKDLLGKGISEVFPELKGTGAFELVDHVFETGESFSAPEYASSVDLNNEDDRQGYFNFSMEPLKNDSGEIYAVIAMMHPITEQVHGRKKLEDSESLMRLALVLTNQTVFKQDKQLRYTWICNTHPLFLMKGIIGKTDSELLNNQAAEILTTVKQTVLNTGKTFKGEIEYEIDGKPLVFEVIIEATKNIDGIIDGIIAVSDDITKRKQAANKIKESEMQHAFLLKLSDALRLLSTPQQIKIKAMQVLGEHLNVSRCYYAEVLKDRKHCVIDNSFSSGLGTIDGTYRLEDFGKDKVAVLQRGEIILTADVANDTSVTQEERDRNLEMQIHSYINVPLVKNNKLICFLGVNQSVVRNWTAHDLTIVQETAERTWAAMEIAKAEEALRKSEEKYRTLFTSIDQGFTLCELIRNKEGKGIDFYMLEVNPTYEQQTGVRKEMVLGKPILQVFPSLDIWIKTYAAVVDNQRPVVFEHYFEDTDRWFAIKAYPVEKERFAVLFSNITERKKAEEKIKESESRFRSMADASPMLIWTIDANGLSSYYNKTFLDFIGVSKDDDISDWKKIVHPDDAKTTFDTINTAIAERSTYSLECRLLRADGQWRWVLAQGNPRIGANNEFLGFVGSSIDITERKQFEYELMEAKVSAENAAKSRQQFLSTMSHEIRTPLNSIIGFTNVLFKTELGEEQKEFVQAIKTSGKSLNLLINDILDLAKVDAGKMTFEKQPCEIRKSITLILHSFDMKIKEKNLELVEEYDNKIPSILLGDSLRLNQIFLNLISNAVKFTHKGKIKLSVELLSETAENVTLKFVVTDSGIGIADNKLDSIFNLFEQADYNTSSSYGGTGLGLAIVKQLVESQGGSISVKSKLDEGSAFSFILPFGKTNIKLEAEIEILKPDIKIKNLRILVAEDVSLNQLLIKIILNDFGFEPEIVGNGKLAIEKMQTNTYDIILMDLQMPEMNGFKATEYIRKKMNSKIPIIALTADVTTVDIKKCKTFGMNDYISKPIDENLLYTKIVELVKKKV